MAANNNRRLTVRELTGKAPHVMIVVLTRDEARNVRESSHILLGSRVILPIDGNRSIVVYSDTPGDFNTVAAHAKLYLTTEVLPFVKYNLPQSFMKLAQSVGMIVLFAIFVTLTGAASYKLTSYASSLLTGLLLASETVRGIVDLVFTWLGNAVIKFLVKIYFRLAYLLRDGAQAAVRYIISSLEAYVA